MPAVTSFWVCGQCGFVNTPHAFRRDKANEKCEQDGYPRAGAVDQEGKPGPDNADIAPQDAVIAKRA
jgi:hypothetical protein